MATEEQRIVSDEGFITSIRDLGITTTDAVNEFVDNSFDAEADNIWITIDKNDDDNLFMIIEDDGNGIPEDQLQKILSFGGRLPSSKRTTGKFGWGLSSSACCQSPFTEIYSKTNGEEDFYFNYINLEELKEQGGYLPNTIKKNPKEEYDLNIDGDIESGTVVVLKYLDRAERKTKKSLIKLIKENLAIVQRKFLASGNNIIINNDEVIFHDPLMLMDNFDGENEIGKGENYAEISPIVFEDIKDENGDEATIEIKISKLPIKNIIENELQNKYNINTGHQGFYIMRHNRQIAGGQTLYLFNRHNNLNYFRGEISFPPCLDNKFGVQTNKSRFSLDDNVRKELTDRVENTIAQIRKDIINETKSANAKKAKGSDTERPLSEKIADKALPRLKGSGYKPSQKKKEKDKEDLEKEKREKIKKVKEDEDLDEEQKEDLIDKIEIAFQKDRTFKRIIDIIGTGEFYKMKHKGNRIEVVINQSHGFYQKIYEKATQNPKLQVLMDIFLFTLAQAEDEYFDNKEVRGFYKSQRREWSTIMSTFLDVAEEELQSE